MEASWAGKSMPGPSVELQRVPNISASANNSWRQHESETEPFAHAYRANPFEDGIALACLLAVFPAHIFFAQAVASAKMHSVVTDESGLVVPNAQVNATQTESGFAASAMLANLVKTFAQS